MSESSLIIDCCVVVFGIVRIFVIFVMMILVVLHHVHYEEEDAKYLTKITMTNSSLMQIFHARNEL